jgi:hypothetical protein
VATTSVSARAVEAVPRLGEPDIIRIVQLLPGVAAKNDFSTGFNVRGGEADQNLILIDGYPIYNPFHLGGLFSTFMDATVRDATLMTGGFPARYGGRLSSVLDVRSSKEERPGIHGSGEISLLGATAALAGPLTSGSWLLAARRTYADKVVDAFSDEVLPYHFKDVHGHLTTALPGNFRFSITGYGGNDELNADLSEVQDDSAQASPSEGTFKFAWGNSVVGSTVSKSIPYAFGADSLRGEVRVSRSRFSTIADAGEGSATVRNQAIDWRAGGSLSLHAASHDVALGAEHSSLRTSTYEGSPQTDPGSVARVQRGSVSSLFVDDLWRVSSRLLVQAGIRYEQISSRDWHALSPRLSVKYFVTRDLALTAATACPVASRIACSVALSRAFASVYSLLTASVMR